MKIVKNNKMSYKPTIYRFPTEEYILELMKQNNIPLHKYQIVFDFISETPEDGTTDQDIIEEFQEQL
jgi:hypothetical protein